MSLSYVSSFSTYHHFFIRQWNAMYDLLLREQTDSENKQESQMIDPPVLRSAFNGIFAGFFRTHLEKYTDITKYRFASHIKNDEGLKAIDDFYTRLGVSEHSLESNLEAKLGKQQRELNSLMKDHHEQWLAFLESSQNLVIDTLRQNNIAIVDSEIAEFKLLENARSLRDRLTELKLDTFSETAVLTVRDYLYHKTIVAMRNAFYRQQQPAEIANMKKHLKKLKPTFTQVSTEEQALLEKQKLALEAIGTEEAH